MVNNGLRIVSNTEDSEEEEKYNKNSKNLKLSKSEEIPVKNLGKGKVESVPNEKFKTIPPPYPIPKAMCSQTPFEPIPNTSDIPYRWICHLIMTGFPNSPTAKYQGTGFLIGPKTVVTAGHNLIHKDLGGWATTIVVTPARNGNSKPYGSITTTGKDFRTVDLWKNKFDKNYDFGAIILPGNGLGNSHGCFEFSSFPDNVLKEVTLNHAGYPGDTETKTYGNLQYFTAAKCELKDSLPKRLLYSNHTMGGCSGGPVFVTTPDNRRIVVGIHAYGGECPNKATRITDEFYEIMKQLRNL